MNTAAIPVRHARSGRIAPTSPGPRELLAICIDRLPEQAAQQTNGSPRHFADAALALGALPLATAEYGVTTNRLQNARTYFRAGEWGAARYELQLLRRRLPAF